MTTAPVSSYVTYFWAPPLPVVGRTVLVVAFDGALNNVNYSEAFVFMETRTAEEFSGLRWRADPRQLTAMGIVRDILEGEARRWAHAEVDFRISSGQQPPHIVLPTWDWQPATRQVLLDLWLRGKFIEPIKTHCGTSKSAALRNDVDVCQRLLPGMIRSESL